MDIDPHKPIPLISDAQKRIYARIAELEKERDDLQRQNERMRRALTDTERFLQGLCAPGTTLRILESVREALK